MKKVIIIVLSCILFISLVITSIIQPVCYKSFIKMHIPVDTNRLYKDVEKLSTIDPPRNFLHIASLDTIAAYIESEFSKLSCRVTQQTYEVEGRQYKNIIASFGPEQGERIIVGAHYDVAGDQPGADDNASAVAGLLETARLIDMLKPVLKYRIDMVAYTLEESPFFRTHKMGSAIHAKSLYDNNIKIRLMVCLEMIGYYNNKPNSQAFPLGILKWFYPTTGNFIAVVGKLGQSGPVRRVKKLMRQVAHIDVYSINAPQQLRGIDFSDHRNYWYYNYKALMINDTSFYRNTNYHQPTDTIDTLDFQKMAEVIKGVYWAVINY